MTDPRSGPVFLSREDAPEVDPSQAAPILDLEASPALLRLMAASTRPKARWAAWFWSLLLAFVGFMASLAAYDYIARLLERSPILGGIASALLAALLIVLAAIILREIAAIARLSKVDALQRRALDVAQGAGLDAAKALSKDLRGLYGTRPELQGPLATLAAREAEIFDPEGLLAFAEREVMPPLDAAAQREIERAVRLVATTTAMVPIALADLFAALAANLRMIRRISEIYGGRAGTIGAWRLTKVVFQHLMLTGALEVGDDLIGSLAGGGLLARVSRRFGEGVVNGALTARVGLAALEVCRPLPFASVPRPSVTALIGRALKGLFSKD